MGIAPLTGRTFRTHHVDVREQEPRVEVLIVTNPPKPGTGKENAVAPKFSGLQEG